jgi:hypothetical protein
MLTVDTPATLKYVDHIEQIVEFVLAVIRLLHSCYTLQCFL